MYSIQWYKSIKEIDPSEWDDLAGSKVEDCHAWLTIVEDTFDEKPDSLYAVVKKGEQIVGGCICYTHRQSARLNDLDTLILGRIKHWCNRMGITLAPVLYCGHLHGSDEPFLFSRNLDEGELDQIFRLLLEAVEEKAQKCKCALCIYNMPETSESFSLHMKQRGYYKTTDFPSCYLDIEWDSFEGYKRFIQKVISKKMKRSIQHEINRNNKDGVIIATHADIQNANDTLYQLIDDHYRRLNQKPYPFTSQFLIRLKKTFKDKGTIYTASKNGTYIAVCASVQLEDTVYVPVIGVNHDVAGNDYTYFNLAFYQPIRDALEAGVKRIIFGNAQYRVKLRRGCKLQNITVYYKPRHNFFNLLVKYWFKLHEIYFLRKVTKQVNEHVWW